MRYVLILLGLLVAGKAQAMDCDVAPTCEELGYSQDNDPYCADNGYMFCPLDHSYKKCVNMDCTKLGFTEDDKTSWCGKLIKCRGNAKMTLCQNLCEIADVLYDNGTCGYPDEYDSNDKTKTPVGVVFYVTDEGRHGKVLALKELEGKYENFYNFSDTENLTKKYIPMGGLDWRQVMRDYSSEDLVEAFQTLDPEIFDGKGNTQKMLQGTILAKNEERCKTLSQNSREYEWYCQATAALYCLSYAPSEKEGVNAGNWYMPSLGETMQAFGYDFEHATASGDSGAIGDVRPILNKSLRTLASKGVAAETIYDWFSWTSTRHSYASPVNTFKTFNFYSGGISSDNANQAFPLRPMLEF